MLSKAIGTALVLMPLCVPVFTLQGAETSAAQCHPAISLILTRTMRER